MSNSFWLRYVTLQWQTPGDGLQITSCMASRGSSLESELPRQLDVRLRFASVVHSDDPRPLFAWFGMAYRPGRFASFKCANNPFLRHRQMHKSLVLMSLSFCKTPLVLFHNTAARRLAYFNTENWGTKWLHIHAVVSFKKLIITFYKDKSVWIRTLQR
jgi:hypothetical protein